MTQSLNYLVDENFAITENSGNLKPSLTLCIGPRSFNLAAYARAQAAQTAANRGRIINYGVSSGSSGYRPATYKARSSYGRR